MFNPPTDSPGPGPRDDMDADILGAAETLGRALRLPSTISWEGFGKDRSRWVEEQSTWDAWLRDPFKSLLAPHMIAIFPLLAQGDFKATIALDTDLSGRWNAGSAARSREAAAGLADTLDGGRASRCLAKLVAGSPSSPQLSTALVAHARDRSLPILPTLLAYCRLEYSAGGGRDFAGEVAVRSHAACREVLDNGAFPPLRSI